VLPAPELADGSTGVRDGTKPDRGKHQRRRPAFGAVDQELDLARREVETAAVDQQFVGFPLRERELART
jgi:hypothetical protein